MAGCPRVGRRDDQDRDGRLVPLSLSQRVTDPDGKSYADSFSSDALVRPASIEASEELARYLELFRSRFSFDDVLGYFERARALRVLALGEAIIDEYEYCESIGKSGKEPILAARYVSLDRFAGGILAVANQIGVVAQGVTVITYLGERDSHEAFIRSSLRRNVSSSLSTSAMHPRS